MRINIFKAVNDRWYAHISPSDQSMCRSGYLCGPYARKSGVIKVLKSIYNAIGYELGME